MFKVKSKVGEILLYYSVEDQKHIKDTEYNFKLFNWSYIILYK